MKKIILSILLLGFILVSCTKETITPNNNNTIPENGDYILIKTGSHCYYPSLIITTEVVIYSEYEIENSYVIHSVIYDSYIIVDTIVKKEAASGNNYYIPRIKCDIEPAALFQNIDIQYLDDTYEYEKTIEVYVFDDFIEIDNTLLNNNREYIDCWYKGNLLF